MDIYKLYNEIKCRWTNFGVVDRLIHLAGEGEASWLEFKYTMGPPKGWEEKPGKVVQNVPGDYELNVVKAIVALANEKSGGIILLGIGQGNGAKPQPADLKGLCSKTNWLPQQIPETEGPQWDTDKWEQSVHLALRPRSAKRDKGPGKEDNTRPPRPSWEDRFGCRWECSANLEDFIKYENGIYHRQPVLILIVEPSPRPVWLICTNRIEKHECPRHQALEQLQKSLNGLAPNAAWNAVKTMLEHNCKWQDAPDGIVSRQIMRRRGTSSVEWDDLADFVAQWGQRSPYDFDDINKRDLQDYAKFRMKGSVLGSFIQLRNTCYRRLLPRLDNIGMKADRSEWDPHLADGVTVVRGGTRDGRKKLALALCRNMLCRHRIHTALPFFWEGCWSIDWQSSLRNSTRKFLLAELTGPNNSQRLMDHLCKKRLLQIIILAPERSDFGEAKLEELWHRAVKEFICAYPDLSIVIFTDAAHDFMSGMDSIRKKDFDILFREFEKEEIRGGAQ